MTEDTLISDLTVSQFRALMQECFDADRRETSRRKAAELQPMNEYRIYGRRLSDAERNEIVKRQKPLGMLNCASA